MGAFTVGPPAPDPRPDTYYGCPHYPNCDTEPVPEHDYDPRRPPTCNAHWLAMDIPLSARR